jgi:hypothetical protein
MIERDVDPWLQSDVLEALHNLVEERIRQPFCAGPMTQDADNGDLARLLRIGAEAIARRRLPISWEKSRRLIVSPRR